RLPHVTPPRTRGARVTAAPAFLPPAPRRPNLTVLTHAHVTAIVLDGKRATGVCFSHGGRGGVERTVSANREVILAGGAYNSPMLLQLSGIGPPPLLTSLRIPVPPPLPPLPH